MAPPSVSTLPVELLEQIAEIVCLEEKLVLCRVSRLFHSITLRSVYRDVYLESPSIVIACCRTLATNAIAARSVKSLSIVYTPVEPTGVHYFSTFYSIISRALSCLSQLQELRLMVYDAHLISTLASAHFPYLHHFECYLTLTPSLVTFLNKHPTISYLQIAPHEALGQSSSYPPSSSSSAISPASPNRVHLPTLQYFTGNAECISQLEPHGPPLRAAFLFWDAVDSTPQDTIRALERSSHTLNVITCRRRGWNLDLFELVSGTLPDVYIFSLTNLLVVDSKPTEVYLSAIKSFLPRFTNLRKLHLHCVDMWGIADIRCSLDDDYLTVCAWGLACPSLVECILPHSYGLAWTRVCLPSSSSLSLSPPSSPPSSPTSSSSSSSSSIWIPDPEYAHIHGMDWIWKMLASRAPAWVKLAEIVKDRIGVVPGLGMGRTRVSSATTSGRGGVRGGAIGVMRSRSASLGFPTLYGGSGGRGSHDGYEAVLGVLRELRCTGDVGD